MSRNGGERPVRVCVVNPYGYELFDPEARASQVFGGAEVQLYYLATALAALDGFEVSMIVERPAGRTIPPFREGVRMFGVPPISARFARLRDRLPVPAPGYWTAMRQAGADVYLQRGGAVLTADVAGFSRLRKRAFAFMVAHDWDCDHSHRRAGQYLAGACYTAGLRSADLVFAQSAHQQALLRRHHGIESIVQRTVYPASPRTEVKRQHVLWVGRCLGWKRPRAFLDLAACRPDTEFVMACPVYQGERALYDEVVTRAGRLPNVRFLDFVPFAATDDLFRRASVYVNTSVAEGFPNTFVQAARTATPVLSLDVDPDGMLATEDMGACAHGDPERLGRLLGDLLDDPATWRRQADNSYRYFCREHDLTRRIGPFAAALRALGG